MGRLLFATAFIIFLVSSASGAIIDLTDYNSSGSINNALFVQYKSQDSSGTGLINSFLRIQNKGTEKGYNTDGPLEYDTKSGVHTHAITVDDVPTVYLPGSEFNYYREFLLDINENTKDPLLTLDSLEIYVEPVPDITDYASDPFTNLIFDLNFGEDSWVILNSALNAGSGKGDMLLHIPDYLFGTDENSYVYLYAEFGLTESSNAGFEEWATRAHLLPDLPDVLVPLPASVWLLAPGLLWLAKLRRK